MQISPSNRKTTKSAFFSKFYARPKNNWVVKGQDQNCTRPEVFVISYLLFWPACIWRFFWRKNYLDVCLLKSGQWKVAFLEAQNFSRQITMFSAFHHEGRWKQKIWYYQHLRSCLSLNRVAAWKKDYIQIMHHYTLGKKVCYSAKNPKADGKMSSRFGA